jgi:hypothetical protein
VGADRNAAGVGLAAFVAALTVWCALPAVLGVAVGTTLAGIGSPTWLAGAAVLAAGAVVVGWRRRHGCAGRER